MVSDIPRLLRTRRAASIIRLDEYSYTSKYASGLAILNVE